MAVNDLNQFVIPYRTANGHRILWGQAAEQDNSLDEYGSTRWDTLKTITYDIFNTDLGNGSGSNTPWALHTMNNEFYVLLAHGYLKITTNHEFIFNEDFRFQKLFSYNDTIYGVVDTNGADEIWSSSNGIDWTFFAQNESEINYPWMLKYKEIEGVLLAYEGDQIYQVTLDHQTIQFNELWVEGIKGHSITSLNKLNDQLFVTTFSGVFYTSFSSINRQ